MSLKSAHRGLSCLALLAPLIAFAGCARYVVTDGSTLFIGSFCKEQKRISSASYHRIHGVGIKLGAFKFGAGSFDSAVLTIPQDSVGEIFTPIADVTILTNPSE